MKKIMMISLCLSMETLVIISSEEYHRSGDVPLDPAGTGRSAEEQYSYFMWEDHDDQTGHDLVSQGGSLSYSSTSNSSEGYDGVSLKKDTSSESSTDDFIKFIIDAAPKKTITTPEQKNVLQQFVDMLVAWLQSAKASFADFIDDYFKKNEKTLSKSDASITVETGREYFEKFKQNFAEALPTKIITPVIQAVLDKIYQDYKVNNDKQALKQAVENVFEFLKETLNAPAQSAKIGMDGKPDVTQYDFYYNKLVSLATTPEGGKNDFVKGTGLTGNALLAFKLYLEQSPQQG